MEYVNADEDSGRDCLTAAPVLEPGISCLPFSVTAKEQAAEAKFSPEGKICTRRSDGES